MTKTIINNSKPQSKLEEVLKDNFLDLCIRIHNLCEDKTLLLTRLVFDLTENNKVYEEGYIPDEADYIETIKQIESLLDNMEDAFEASVH